MASTNPQLARAVIDYARACQHPDDGEAITAAQAALATARVAAHIERTLADAPPLTASQRRQLTELIEIGGGVA